jgi:hypothetical protein
MTLFTVVNDIMKGEEAPPGAGKVGTPLVIVTVVALEPGGAILQT